MNNEKRETNTECLYLIESKVTGKLRVSSVLG